jgi:aldehyde:ferredoxin oxidoreductase
MEVGVMACLFHAKKIEEISYGRLDIEKGYANRTLYIDVSHTNSTIFTKPVTKKMKETFIGGKGFCLWLLWNAVEDTTKWNDSENAICIASGPLGGTLVYPGAGKSIVTTISPLTGIPIDSNVGGHFGPFLKFAGFDALEITGKTPGDIVIFIDGVDRKIQILKMHGLPNCAHEISDELTKYFGNGRPQDISVVSTGPGAKHTLMGCLNFSWFDRKRKRVRYKQAGRGGIGTVLADKGIKAIVARWDSVKMDTNNPDDTEALKNVARKHSEEIRKLDSKQMRMSVVGTTHLITIMNEANLLPVKNFKYGTHPEAANLGAEVFERMFNKGFDGCWKGCALACAHGIKDFVPITGHFKGQKVWVDGPEYETIAACGSNLGIFDPYFVVEMNFYCDTYGLDTISTGISIAFAMECFERGLINKKHTGGLKLPFGNKYSALRLLHQMAKGRGFGSIVGQGVRRMKNIFVEQFNVESKIIHEIGMEAKGLEFSLYITKESLAQQGGYGLSLKGPQHDEAWLIFEDMIRNNIPTSKDKAEALWWFPMWRTWFGLNGLCKLPWNDVVPEDNKDTKEPAKVLKHAQWYVEFFNAVTGKKAALNDLIAASERVYNFQRIFNLRMGSGQRKHDNIPYRAMGPATVEEYELMEDLYDKQLADKKIKDVDIGKMDVEDKVLLLRWFREKEYEKLKDAVYKRRGWTKNGIPTFETIRRLSIDFTSVAKLLKKQGVKK